MVNGRSSLTFNWKIKGEILVEIFSNSKYEPSEDTLEMCDYIFQMHSVLCSYRFSELQSKYEKLHPFVNEYLSLNISLDDSFVDAIRCLKSIFASFLRYEFYCSCDLPAAIERGNLELIKRHTFEFLNELPQSDFCLFLTSSLNDAMNALEKKGDLSEITKWLNDTVKRIQQKADDVMAQMESYFEKDYWDDFEEFFKEKCEGRRLMSLKTKIEKFEELSNCIVTKLRTLMIGYTKYVRGRGCYALCIADGKKYYSLSGVGDYVGKWKNRSQIMGADSVDITILKNFLEPGNAFVYAPLTDDVLCYGLWKRNCFCNPYLSSPEKFFDAIQLFSDFCARDVSCCERKIFANCPKARDFKFFIRYAPCFLCRPAMLPKDKCIVSFVPAANGKSLKKIKINERTQWYDVENISKET